MRKIVAGLFISLDGVTESPENWNGPFFNDEMGQAVGESIAKKDTLLLGRRTFEDFAAYWPGKTGEDDPFAEFINDTPKVVVSTTLGDVGRRQPRRRPGAEGATRRRHRDDGQRHARPVAVAGAPARRARPDDPPDRIRVWQAVVRRRDVPARPRAAAERDVQDGCDLGDVRSVTRVALHGKVCASPSVLR
jgi:RibD domain-containing protein